jgi:hypothetical protein
MPPDQPKIWDALRHRRSIPIGPAVKGVIHHKCTSDAVYDREGLGPILSLLWVPLQPGVEFHDSTRAPARLWRAALDYISQLPGYSGVTIYGEGTQSRQWCY